MTSISLPNTRTTMPPEGAEPGPREAVSARAQIIGIAETRRREVIREISECSERLKRLLMEEVQLRHHLEAAGVVTEEGE